MFCRAGASELPFARLPGLPIPLYKPPIKVNIACLVPSILPDLRHLKLLKDADRIIYLTDEPFSRKSQAHRGRIAGNDSAPGWLTLPVAPQDKKKPLRQVRIEGAGWIGQFMKTLASASGQALYYDFYEAELRADFETAWHAGRDERTDDKTYARLLPMIRYLNKRLFAYLELPAALAQKPEWMDTSTFNHRLYEYGAAKSLELWIEPRGPYYRQLGSLPPQVTVIPSGPVLPGYTRGIYPPAQTADEYGLLDLLLHHGPLSFRVTDKLGIT